jgi:hypothetical protein
MKTTLLFLSLLVLSTCSKLEMTDPAFIELSRDVRAEGIFAAMSMQLTNEGGFDRVLALLNELVEEAKHQLHENTTLFSGVDARCSVAESKYQEKQDYYESRAGKWSDALKEAQEEKTESEVTSEARKNAHKSLNDFRTSQIENHEEQKKFVEERLLGIAEGVKSLEDALNSLKQVKSDDASTAFLQKKLEKVSDSFLETHSIKVILPSGFVELAASDDQVKQRIHEWLSNLRILHLERQNEWESIRDKRQALHDQILAEVDRFLGDTQADIEHFSSALEIFKKGIENAEKQKNFFDELSGENKGIAETSREYCKVERHNFNEVKIALEAEIVLFKDIRAYFKDHYTKLNQWIQQKYKS